MVENCTILGIDPGYARMGWGVIEVINGSMRCVAYGCVETPKEEEMGTRLAFLNSALEQIIYRHQPHEIAVEELFFAKNQKTAMLVAHARGVIMMRAANHTGKTFSYRPNVIKQSVTGASKADKRQIQSAVTQILGINAEEELDDTADALAIAITHILVKNNLKIFED